MARNKHPSRKKRLITLNKQTKLAPFWTFLKKYGKGKKVHPSRHTAVKRSWRRIKTKA